MATVYLCKWLFVFQAFSAVSTYPRGGGTVGGGTTLLVYPEEVSTSSHDFLLFRCGLGSLLAFGFALGSPTLFLLLLRWHLRL